MRRQARQVKQPGVDLRAAAVGVRAGQRQHPGAFLRQGVRAGLADRPADDDRAVHRQRPVARQRAGAGQGQQGGVRRVPQRDVAGEGEVIGEGARGRRVVARQRPGVEVALGKTVHHCAIDHASL